MANDEKTKEMAKELYLEFDKNGERRFSYRKLASILSQKFGEKVHHDTIRRWSKKEGWELLAQDARNQGIEKAINATKEKDEAIIEAKAKVTSQIYQINKQKNDYTGFLVVELLKFYVEEYKKGKMTIKEIFDEIPVVPRDLEYMNRNAFDNLERLSGGKEEDKLDKIMRRIDGIEG